jgi:hypothetical protein
LPSDPTTAEFIREYHAALLDAGEDHDLDDWTELQAMHLAQRCERASTGKPRDTQRAERDLALCARLLLAANPVLDPVIVPVFEQLACDLAMLRARDRALAGLA